MSSDGPDHGEITLLLQEYARGNQHAFHSLIERVYQELRRLASSQLRREAPNPMMGPTVLVNEAYLRLIGPGAAAKWENRRHFFAAASETMRRILVDQARQRMTQKRDGTVIGQSVDELDIPVELPDEELIDIDAALKEFGQIEPDKAELVKLRFFAGFSEIEAAEILGISRATASRNWTYAKAWLFDWLKTHGESAY